MKKRGITDDSNVDTDANRTSKKSRIDATKSFRASNVDLYQRNDWHIQVSLTLNFGFNFV